MHVRFATFLCLLGLAGTCLVDAHEQVRTRRLEVDDSFRLRRVSEPRLSPEGQWIAYSVATNDLERDEARSRLWMVPAEGGEPFALTVERGSATAHRFSPDGKYVSFVSSRDDEASQVYVLHREGGEAIPLTNVEQGVSAHEWSPDGTRLALVIEDPEPDLDEGPDEKTPPPWVIDRLQFKRDYEGYLDRRRAHLYVLDVGGREAVGEPRQVTFGDFDDSEPAWSPDGTRIAFVSNRTDDPDANYDTDVWTVTIGDGGERPEPRRVTSSPGADDSPAWSPDGSWIAHRSATDTDALVYVTYDLAVSPANGGPLRNLTAELDRHVFWPLFSADGRHLYFVMQDEGEQPLARVPVEGGAVERVVGGDDVVESFDVGRNGELALAVSRPHGPAEVFVHRAGALEPRTEENRALLDGLELGAVEKISFRSKDGTPLEAFVVKPPDFDESTSYPALLRIHGGPVDQFDARFHFEAQLFAANGYLVVLPNPRGSSGYGQDFSLSIWRDWGGVDFEDVMAAVDSVIERGWADPARLGVGGWSYGGLLTNHVITKTDRFAAAVTGASSTLYVSNYGHDQYQRWWTGELGYPWEPESRAIWERLSPFNDVENVTTPTLIVGGEKDWNVPILNSEQLYQALKALGKTARLVVYPGEHHSIRTPSYRKDLYERYLDWYGRYVKGGLPSE